MKVYIPLSGLERIPNSELTASYVRLTLVVIGLVSCLISYLN
jgi:hypothetical protein